MLAHFAKELRTKAPPVSTEGSNLKANIPKHFWLSSAEIKGSVYIGAFPCLPHPSWLFARQFVQRDGRFEDDGVCATLAAKAGCR